MNLQVDVWGDPSVKKYNANARILIIILIAVVLSNLCCLSAIYLTLTFIPGWQFYPTSKSVGFTFRERSSLLQNGDDVTARQQFIQQYTIPEDGEISAVAYLNDMKPKGLNLDEEIYLLILRPEGDGMKIIYRAEIPAEELSPAKSGVVIYSLPAPLTVKKGDVFGHWQQVNIPIRLLPIEVEVGAVDGFTVGKRNFTREDIQVGNLVNPSASLGLRDYFINFVVQPQP